MLRGESTPFTVRLTHVIAALSGTWNTKQATPCLVIASVLVQQVLEVFECCFMFHFS